MNDARPIACDARFVEIPSPPPVAPLALPAAAATGHARFLETRTFGALDGLRAIAILAVVWHHTHPGIAGLAATTRGFLGVDLFFVISGFLIVTLLLRERAASGTISLKKFWMRRSIRILPVYWLTLLAWTVIAFAPMVSEELRAGLRHDLPLALVYASNWAVTASALGITWSLASEEQFYLVWPPLERLGRPVALTIVAIGLVLSLALQLGAFDAWIGDARARLPILQVTFMPILLGVLLAHALHAPRTFAWAQRALGHRLAAPIALAVVVAIASIPADDLGALRPLLHLAMAVLLAAAVVREDHALANVLAWRPLARIGTLSYGLYLFHMLAIDVATRGLGRVGLTPASAPWALFAATLVLAVVAAELSYRFVESPLLRRKKKWAAIPESAPTSNVPVEAVTSPGPRRPALEHVSPMPYPSVP